VFRALRGRTRSLEALFPFRILSFAVGTPGLHSPFPSDGNRGPTLGRLQLSHLETGLLNFLCFLSFFFFAMRLKDHALPRYATPPLFFRFQLYAISPAEAATALVLCFPFPLSFRFLDGDEVRVNAALFPLQDRDRTPSCAACTTAGVERQGRLDSLSSSPFFSFSFPGKLSDSSFLVIGEECCSLPLRTAFFSQCPGILVTLPDRRLFTDSDPRFPFLPVFPLTARTISRPLPSLLPLPPPRSSPLTLPL